MKQKLSITIDEGTVKILDEVLKEGIFRNRSHMIEVGLNKLLREMEN